MTMLLRALQLRFSKLWDPPVVVLDAPLLFETKLHYLCKTTVVVFCPSDTQMQRLLARDPGRSTEQVEQIIKAQLDIELKKGLADLWIDNSGTLMNLRKETDAAMQYLQQIN